MKFDIIIFIVWCFIGLVNVFATEKISKFSYFIVWMALMAQLLGNITRHL